MARRLGLVGLACLASAAAFVINAPAGIVVSNGFGRVARRTVQSRGSPAATSGVGGLRALADGGIDFTVLHQVFSGLADATAATADAAADAAANNGGVFAGLVTATEAAITMLHDALKGAGVEQSYGYAIIGFTLFIKGVTFPLTYQQLASTTKMQTLQPKVKDIQKRLANNPEAANKAIADLYKEEEVNPLSGCLPSLAQIPIFISLYRALLNLAKENKLDEGFLWLPSLEGPVFGAPPTESLNWIKTWENGVPALGWHDTLCYLSIPVILVITQSISQQLISPPKKEGAEADTSQAILKYLPLLIGWFSLNVPSGLGLYWIVNNIVSTAASVLIRQQLGLPATAGATPGVTAEANATVAKAKVLDAEVVKSVSDMAPGTQLEEAKGFGSAAQSEGEDVQGEIIAANSSVKPKKSSGKKKRSKKGGR
ncbi:Alb3-like protein, thylakoidal inner membrane insertase [Tribonema minus]|uniref:Alb3-like protein, thylakoidal inner membrane insertase n=1 Tax=Tribonema minus TaxID=303371 RepID=A0A835YLS0_9STRA|nr:Alb3-like protein, thylakoidal inner membrane insertase [Tribonema minus]